MRCAWELTGMKIEIKSRGSRNEVRDAYSNDDSMFIWCGYKDSIAYCGSLSHSRLRFVTFFQPTDRNRPPAGENRRINARLSAIMLANPWRLPAATHLVDTASATFTRDLIAIETVFSLLGSLENLVDI